MKKILIISLLATTANFIIGKEFKFAAVCSDNMVIQREVAAPVWGFGEAGKAVKVLLNNREVGTTKIDENGRWEIKLPPQKANKRSSTITAICGAEKHSITNVLFGDVWFGSGQSNMSYDFNGYGRLPIGGEEFIAKASGNPNIRTLTMRQEKNGNSPYPREDVEGVAWEISTPEAIRKSGMALYVMGAKLEEELDIPIGLVNASWPATKIDSWIGQIWAKDNGKGYAKNIANYWYNRWNGFVKDGGVENYEKRIFEWNQRFEPASNFLKTKPSLFDVDFVETDIWKDVVIDGRGFQADPFPKDFSGDIWLRATFELTEEDLKKNWAITYEESFGSDVTYLNGKAFGASGNPYHGYGFPTKEHGRVGTNVLAIRYTVRGGGDGKPVGMLKPVFFSIWPSRAERREFKFKACFGEVVPKDIWNHPECRKPDDARNISIFSATTMDAGLVNPLYPMAIKGAVWYQGCSDLGNGKYGELFDALVGGWRARFTYNEKLPVIVTEIAPHRIDSKPNSSERIKNGETAQPTGSVVADMRYTLNTVAASTPDCGIVSLLDLGEEDIHPVRKIEVGERYAAWALQNVYGKRIEGTCPTVEKVEWVGNKAIIHLKNARGLKARDDKAIKGFEISGPVEAHPTELDKTGKPKEGVVYYYADAKIFGNTIVVTSPKVKEAFSIRYAWFDLDLGWNVVNGAGLPLGTYRAFKDENYYPQLKIIKE